MAKHITMKDIKPLKVSTTRKKVLKVLKSMGFDPYQSSKKKARKKT